MHPPGRLETVFVWPPAQLDSESAPRAMSTYRAEHAPVPQTSNNTPPTLLMLAPHQLFICLVTIDYGNSANEHAVTRVSNTSGHIPILRLLDIKTYDLDV